MSEIYDPQWLRGSYHACLWDGGDRPAGAEFCSTDCVEAYAAWDLAQREWDDLAELVEEPTARSDVRQSDMSAAEMTLSMRSRTNSSPSTALRRPNSSARAAPM